jgi:putative membrane protein
MAQQLIDDHTRTSGELMQLAQPKGLTPPASLDAKHAAMLSRLRGMSGAEFEREYVRQAGVKAHEQAVKLFRDQSRKGRDADLRAFAARTLPALEGHLQQARSHGGMRGGHGSGGGMNGNTNRNSNSNTGGGNANNSNR